MSLPDKQQLVVDLSSSKVDQLARALERNWIAQLILASISVCLIFDIGGISKFVSEYFHQPEYSRKPLATIIPALMIYYFMKGRESQRTAEVTRATNNQKRRPGSKTFAHTRQFCVQIKTCSLSSLAPAGVRSTRVSSLILPRSGLQARGY